MDQENADVNFTVEPWFPPFVEAFGLGDYSTCLEILSDLLEQVDEPEAILLASRLMLICARRDGRDTRALEDSMLELCEGFDWDQQLAYLMLDLSTLDEVLADCPSPEGTCQAHYYEAARLLSEGGRMRAQERLRACLQLTVPCLEVRLAELDLRSLERSTAGRNLTLVERELEGRSRPVLRLHSQGSYEDALSQAVERELEDSSQQVLRLHSQGSYEDALSLAKVVQARAAEQLGEEHPCYATTLNNHGLVLKSMGRLEDALPLYERALEIRRKALGEEDLTFAQSLNNLGFLYGSLRRTAEAEPLFSRALEIRRSKLGANDPATLRTQDGLAQLLVETGNLFKARTLLEDCLKRRRLTLGKDNPEYAFSLAGLANLRQVEGHLAEAEALQREATDIFARSLGELHPQTTSAQIQLAKICRMSGNREDSRDLFDGARLAIISSGRAGCPDYRYCIVQLVELLIEEERFADARRLFLPLVSDDSAWPTLNEPEEVDFTESLGKIYFDTGNWRDAERLLLRSLEIRKELGQADTAEIVPCMLYLAEVYVSLSMLKSSEDLYRKALDITLRTLGEDHAQHVQCLIRLANYHLHEHRPEAARPLLTRAMELSRSGDEEAVLNFREAQHLLNIVDIELGLPVSNESPDSGNLAASSQNAARSASLDSSRLYILAHDSLRQARLQEAETYFRESLALDAKFLGPEHPANATTLINLAALCAATSRTLEAFDLWDEVTSLDDYLLDQHLVLASGPERDQFFTGLREHLNSPLALARETLAEPVELPMAYCSYLDVLPPWCDRRKANPVPAHRKASILAKCLELVLKRKSVQLEVDLAVRGGLAGQQLGRLQPLAKELASVRWQLARSTDGWPEAIRPTADDGKRLRARLEELEKELRRALPTRWLADLLDGVSCHAIAAALPPDSALVEFVVIEPREFQIPPSREGPGFIIERRYLAFIIPAGQPDAIRLFDLGKKASIDLDIVWFRASITGERDVVSSDGGVFVGGRMKNTEDEPEHARSLRRLLFDPIRKALGTTKHYFLVPDGELSRLPFEALPTDNGGLLIDECQVSYLGSGRDVLRFAESPPRPGTQSLVIADPDFDLRVMAPAAVGIAETRDRSLSSLAGITFSRLAGSRREGQEVAALLEAEVWLGEDALESRLKKRVCPRILHVATHGFFMHDETTEARKKGGVEHDSTALEPPAWRRNPLVRSGLALAGANTFLHGEQPPPEAEDGILTAEDVSALDLSGTELVVLSACETGLGEIRTGEGVFGLHRAFRIAGAINLILSLWKVPDESTCLLMNIFYKKVKEGRSFAAALYEAKQSLRFHTIEVGHAGSGKRDLVQFDSTEAAAAEHLMVSKTRPSHRPYSHPYYWAAFAFYGG